MVVFSESYVQILEHKAIAESLTLTHFRPMFPFYTPWKCQKTSGGNLRFSVVFRDYRKGTLVWNEYIGLQKTYRLNIDDTHARFKSKEQSREFQKILNTQDKHIQFILENENEEKYLIFLEIKIKNNSGIYEFDVHRKPALTNLEIKPHSCIPSGTNTSKYSKDFFQELPKSVLKNI